MSEKRPETSADIVTRSKAVRGSALGGVPRPRGRGYSVDLPKHMAECDANYHRLMRLFPDLRNTSKFDFALQLTDLDLQVVAQVVERGPYTSVLDLGIKADGQWMQLAAAPQMRIRVYHDARSAEVISYQNQNRFHGKYEYPNTRMRQRDEKVQVNRFLSEFLNLCLQYGISNHPVSF